MASTRVIQILILTLFYCSLPSLAANPFYNVQSFGAKSDGKSDCTKAFLSAWGAACATTAPATIYVPPGRYLLRNANFAGYWCKNTAITMRIDGTLVAPSNYYALGKTNWLTFEKVTGVAIYGGTLDGQGWKLWACKDSGKGCPQGATSLAFYNSKNIRISGLASLNSEMFHILLDGCNNCNLANMKISAPENSPNTDGIHVEHSTGVSIMSSRIATGDDCISIGPGTSNLWIENVACGPGHGISIGSLAWKLDEAGVQNVTVKKVAFVGTQNGVRVKTWARPCNGFVKDVVYRHLVMYNVKNPIIIDQNYCPHHENCPGQTSGVKISNVAYQDIRGVSATQVAVKFDCSRTHPCSGITLKDLSLSYKDKPATASCANVGGRAFGVVKPKSCLQEEKMT